MRQASRAYLETQVTTTSQGQVLIMLYDGAIKFLTQAKELIVIKDYAGKGKLISSAIDVINELASSLNPEKGGDLAENLNQLYFYCNKRLFLANSRMDTAPIDEVIKILTGIRSAYAQIMDTPEAVEAMAQAAATAYAAKAPRTPVGIQAAPTSNTPKARVHTAYATQSAAAPGAAGAEAPHSGPAHSGPTGHGAELKPGAPAQPELPAPELAQTPERKPAGADMPVILDMPELDLGGAAPPPPLDQGKRMAASSLYRKFAAS